MTDLIPPSRVERKKEETKTTILSTALMLFREQGLAGTSMEQIAEEADIAKGTLYNYFPVKEAILSAYMQRTFLEKNPGRLREMRELADTRARLVRLIGEMAEGARGHREIFEAFMLYKMRQTLSFEPAPEDQGGLLPLAGEIIDLGQQSGEIRPDLPREVLADLFNFTLIEALKQVFKLPDPAGSAKVIDNCIDLFINGVRPRA